MSYSVMHDHILDPINPTLYLNLTTALLTINEQQIRSLFREKYTFT